MAAPKKPIAISKSGGKVTVACKLPHGLRLRVYKMEDGVEPGPAGARPIKVAVPTGHEIVLNGNAVAKGTSPTCEIAGGFALTHNVDRDTFEEWLKQNSDHPAVRQGLIFAGDDPHYVSDQAKEEKSKLNGLEALDMRPSKGKDSPVMDARVPRQIRTADEQAA